jgi:phosphate-selective porin OprO/OprP
MIGDTDGVETSGFYVMPSVMLSEKLQGVVRVEMAESDKSTGLRAASRYTRRVDSLATVETENADGTVTVFDPQRGDEYQAVYVGVNYYLKGDGNKLMLGLESAELDNTKSGKLDSTTVYTAWRTLF